MQGKKKRPQAPMAQGRRCPRRRTFKQTGKETSLFPYLFRGRF
ncbi:MAG: hypothetical protein OJF47_001608 [Nitrospira sp.]|nr:MAG: hypothetical protein OJF47_001608 [Nitrospira sp.]